MKKFKKLSVIAMMCGTVAIGLSYYTHQLQTHHSQVIQMESKRHDAFAERVGKKIGRVASVTSGHSRAVIFDNDAATDDALALIIIGNDPGVALKAITVAGTGEAHGRQGAENMAAISEFLGKPDIPVAYGRQLPLSAAGKPFPDSVRDAMDHLLDGVMAKSRTDIRITDNAVELMKNVIEESSEKVTILATGPLTNIAEFVTQYPQLKNKIEKIVIMGGAVNVPGNVGVLAGNDNNVSEWNFYADPEAAHRVFAANIPMTLVALDATNQVHMSKEFIEAVANEDQPELRLAHHLLKKLIARFGMNAFLERIYMWDGLAAMVMLDPSIAEITPMSLSVDQQNGQVKIASHTDNDMKVNVVTKINKPDAVLQDYVASVKSNHIYAQREFHHDVGRAMAYLGHQNTRVASVGVANWHNKTR